MVEVPVGLVLISPQHLIPFCRGHLHPRQIAEALIQAPVQVPVQDPASRLRLFYPLKHSQPLP